MAWVYNPSLYRLRPAGISTPEPREGHMPIELPPLPYDRAALEPHLSTRTVEQHHDVHQRAHVERVVALTAGTTLAELTLEEVLSRAQGALFEHAAQAANLAVYWRCLRPVAAGGGGEPTGRLAELLARRYRDAAGFRKQFGAAALSLAGSGWVWLVQRRDGGLAITCTTGSGTPLTGSDIPLLGCSVWEHADCLDYPGDRARYLEAYWQLVDWDFAATRLR